VSGSVAAIAGIFSGHIRICIEAGIIIPLQCPGVKRGGLPEPLTWAFCAAIPAMQALEYDDARSRIEQRDGMSSRAHGLQGI
jgi:hypothetical protein